MAKFITTSGAKFTPFTYDELTKPLIQMQQAHVAAQEGYDTLASSAAKLKHYLDQNPEDEEVRRQYDDYMARLQNASDLLYSKGYSQAAARGLSEARTAYQNQIVPIDEALARRRTKHELWEKMGLEHPEILRGKDPGSFALSDYMKDMNFGSFNTYDRNLLEKDARTAAIAAASEIREDPVQWTTKGAPVGYIQALVRNGFTNEEVDKATAALMSGSESTGDQKADVLLRIGRDVYNKSGISSWAADTPGAFEQAISSISAGLRGGVGKAEHKMVQRRDGIYSPNYGKSSSPKSSGKTSYFPSQRISGTEITLDPKARKIIRQYDGDMRMAQAAVNGTVVDRKYIRDIKDLAFDKAPHTIYGTPGGLSEPRRKELYAKYPELAELPYEEISAYANALATSKSVDGLYNKYGLAGDAKTTENLMAAIENRRNSAAQAYTYTDIPFADSKVIADRIKANFTQVGDLKSGDKVTFARKKDGSQLTKKEYDELMKGNPQISIDATSGKIKVYNDAGESGSIRAWLDHQAIRNTPSLYDPTEMAVAYLREHASEPNAERAARIVEYYFSQPLDSMLGNLPSLINGEGMYGMLSLDERNTIARAVQDAISRSVVTSSANLGQLDTNKNKI